LGGVRFAEPQYFAIGGRAWPPLRRVVARGQARPFTLEETQSKLVTLLQRLTLRYLGGAKDLRDRAGVVFTVKLSYLRGWQGLPGSRKLSGNTR